MAKGGRGASTAPFAFATAFANSETPLSETGRWSNTGLGQSNVVSAAGSAYGTSSAAGGGATGDSAAILTQAVPANVSVSVTLKKLSGTVDFQEVELLFRAGAGASALRGYEFFLEQRGQYLSLVKRLGSNGGVEGTDFIFLVQSFPVTSPSDGDVLKGTIIGNTFTAFINNSLIWTHDITLDKNGSTIATYDTGSIGVGFDGPSPGGGTYDDSKWGFKNFSAVAA